jgi:antitoxin CptB
MKELDVLLGRFVDEQWSSASAAEQEAFWRLLDDQDPTLYAYFLGNERPAAADVAALVERIAGAAGGPTPRAGA